MSSSILYFLTGPNHLSQLPFLNTQERGTLGIQMSFLGLSPSLLDKKKKRLLGTISSVTGAILVLTQTCSFPIDVRYKDGRQPSSEGSHLPRIFFEILDHELQNFPAINFLFIWSCFPLPIMIGTTSTKYPPVIKEHS